ncbi:uncharacterized protein LOC125865483 [Solanum stenotomum]|uniref:uncharacterized protein LOC125865483 n=1 Tax=Solanum stenotomum TaxID=172797 RepID=UPI0020D0EBB3|nr:uncharacterized protein LOC125865483 [Solanum stenotomum]
MQSSLKSKLGPKLERKDVEKNRRKYMKNLCNQLYSLIPSTNASTPKETMAVPDQIDAAIRYIESLKMNSEKNKKSTPQIEFHEMGPKIVVVLIIGLDNIATFNNIIRLCYVEGVEVVSTKFELNGNSTLQISHETKVEMININSNSKMEFRGTTLCNNMKELIYGASCSNDMEYSQIHLWDYIIECDALEVLKTPSQNQNMQNVQETSSSFWD